jgi:hypothetical protein
LNARRRPNSNAVTFTRTDRDELTSDWQTVLGGDILAWMVRGGDALNVAAVNGAGHAFRIGQKQLSEGPFLDDVSARLPLHQDLVDPLVAAAVVNDRMAVACGDPEPRLWLINAAGQIEGSPLLPAAPQAPSSIQDRIVVPLPGRIHVVRLSGQPAVQDFALPTGEDRTWMSLATSGADKGIAVTTDGLVLLLKLENSPRPHLGEAARVELGQQVLHPGSAGDGLFAVADASRKVSLFDGERLDPRGVRIFDQPVTNRTWIVSGKLFVEEGQHTLHCIEPESSLPSTWILDLKQASVAGIAPRGGSFIIAQQDGTISLVDRGSGNVLRSQSLGSPLANGPLIAGDNVFVGTIDGTLIRVNVDPPTAVTDSLNAQ